MARIPGPGKYSRRPGKPPEEGRETYTAPRDELGTSDEIVHQGRQDYATERIPNWPQADSARQYISYPEGSQEIQHGVVTWSDSAESNPEKDDIERRHEPGHRRLTKEPPDLEL